MKNKKESILICILIVIIGYSLYIISNKKDDEVILENDNENISGNSLAIMVEGDSGYEIWNQNTWPTDGYEFNDVLSSCENGGILSWDDATKSVILKTNISDKCYVYFDKKILPFTDTIKSQFTGNTTEVASGDEGKLYYHSKDLVDGAGDYSYRYAGNNPNNFVCLGQIQGDGSCDDVKNLYRIIGMFPFQGNEQQTSYSEEVEYRIKLIKSEYITEQELKGTDGTGDGSTLSVNSSATDLARVETKKGIHGFKWNTDSYTDGRYNYWEYKENEGENKVATLNGYLNGYYLNTTMASWKDKIADTTWNIAGGYEEIWKKPGKEVFQNEMSADSEGSYQAPQATSTAKIGLMYNSDYAFAAANNDNQEWETSIYDYDTVSTNMGNNWLFNGV